MECVYEGRLRTWCAIGFRNSANDSSADKAAIRRKFKEDLESALKNNSALKGFVFMTNVHLTVAEVRQFRGHAIRRGMEHADIFTREHLRSVLDSVPGFTSRLKYLEMPMTPEDQVAFVDHYNTQLADMIHRDRESIHTRLARIEFLQWATRPLHYIELYLDLKKAERLRDLPAFRVCMQISRMDETGLDTIAMLGRPEEGGPRDSDGGVWLGTRTDLLENPSAGIRRENDFELFLAKPSKHLRLGITRLEYSPRLTMRDLDRRFFHLHVTKNLADRMSGFALVIDGYMLAEASHSTFQARTDFETADARWDTPLTEEEQGEWCEVSSTDPLRQEFDFQTFPPTALF